MPVELKLPFGIKDGRLIQIAEVEQGLKCGCYCPSCNEPLVARKGRKVVHHFAHYKQTECKTALETSLHLAAKKIIEESGYIVLPEVPNDIFYMRSRIIAPSIKLYFDKIYLEKKYDDFIPDIILETRGKPLCVEIFVTHQIDEIKIEKIEKSNISTIEVDLSKVDGEINFELLKELIVESAENKTWIYNARTEKIRSRIISNSKEKKIINRGLAQHVDYCPIPSRVWNGKPYANFFDDCLGCDYFVPPHDKFREDIMYCIGHKKEEEIQKLLKQG